MADGDRKTVRRGAEDVEDDDDDDNADAGDGMDGNEGDDDMDDAEGDELDHSDEGDDDMDDGVMDAVAAKDDVGGNPTSARTATVVARRHRKHTSESDEEEEEEEAAGQVEEEGADDDDDDEEEEDDAKDKDEEAEEKEEEEDREEVEAELQAAEEAQEAAARKAARQAAAAARRAELQAKRKRLQELREKKELVRAAKRKQAAEEQERQRAAKLELEQRTVRELAVHAQVMENITKQAEHERANAQRLAEQRARQEAHDKENSMDSLQHACLRGDPKACRALVYGEASAALQYGDKRMKRPDRWLIGEGRTPLDLIVKRGVVPVMMPRHIPQLHMFERCEPFFVTVTVPITNATLHQDGKRHPNGGILVQARVNPNQLPRIVAAKQSALLIRKVTCVSFQNSTSVGFVPVLTTLRPVARAAAPQASAGVRPGESKRAEPHAAGAEEEVSYWSTPNCGPPRYARIGFQTKSPALPGAAAKKDGTESERVAVYMSPGEHCTDCGGCMWLKKLCHCFLYNLGRLGAHDVVDEISKCARSYADSALFAPDMPHTEAAEYVCVRIDVDQFGEARSHLAYWLWHHRELWPELLARTSERAAEVKRAAASATPEGARATEALKQLWTDSVVKPKHGEGSWLRIRRKALLEHYGLFLKNEVASSKLMVPQGSDFAVSFFVNLDELHELKDHRLPREGSLTATFAVKAQLCPRIDNPAPPHQQSAGTAGAEVRLQLMRDDITTTVAIRSADRAQFLRSPTLH